VPDKKKKKTPKEKNTNDNKKIDKLSKKQKPDKKSEWL